MPEERQGEAIVVVAVPFGLAGVGGHQGQQATTSVFAVGRYKLKTVDGDVAALNKSA